MDITNFIRNGITYPIGDTKSRESIATAFDSTIEYAEGDYVMYDGTLYKFTSAHTGAWDSSHAEATCVTNELGGGSGGNAKVMYYYQQPVNTATNAEIFRITSGKINTDTVVLECTFADPSYITSDVTWTSYNGYIAFTGTCTTVTTANVTMAYKSDDIITTVGLDLLYEGNPTANTDTNLITGKKFSDYKLLVISTGSTSVNRFTYTIPIGSDFFNPDNNNWIETEAASIWSFNFKYVSDTSFRIQDKGSSISFVRIYGDSKYSTIPSTPNFILEYGTVGPITVPADTYADQAITFTKNFPATPNIQLTFATSSTGAGMGNFSMSTVAASSTGFTIRVFSKDTTQRIPSVNWMAILEVS